MTKTQLLSSITDHIPSLVALYNIKTGQYLYVNKSVKKLLGYHPEDFLVGGTAFISSLVHPDDLPRIVEENQAALGVANQKPRGTQDDEDPIACFEYRMQHKDGTWRWFQTNGTVYSRSESGDVETVLNVSMDITERKRAEEEILGMKEVIVAQAEQRSLELNRTLMQSEAHFRTLVRAVEDYAIFSMDVEGNITSWNEGVESILGYAEEEILGRHYSLLFTPDDIKSGKHLEELKIASRTGSYSTEGIRVRKDSSTFHAVITCTSLHDENGNLKGFTKIMRDVTEKKESEETIRYQAFHDALTGLSNREALHEKFSVACAHAERHGQKLALAFLDLDRFKVINDTLGHTVGDMILKEIADRLVRSVRKNDVVARLGGDEFIILITEVDDTNDAITVAQNILKAMEPVMRIQNHSLHVTASLGIAVFPDDASDIGSMLQNADVALYRAKDRGRNRYQFYNLDMNLKSIERLRLEQDLRVALRQGELEVVYQPYIEIATGKASGVEALVRWNHPIYGLISPSDFIPLAEETGMITAIGNWILRTACLQGGAWRQQGLDLTVSVNLSARQFMEEGVVSDIGRILKETRFHPRLLELEITESVAMENVSRTMGKLADLKSLGIGISIDDFGTGYSSLSYLKRFPVHKIKIDQSFISQAMDDPQDQAIVRAIVTLGKSLGLVVCAEGIEHPDQLKLLRHMECGLAQGYLVSRPMPAMDVTSWFKTRKQMKVAHSSSSP